MPISICFLAIAACFTKLGHTCWYIVILLTLTPEQECLVHFTHLPTKKHTHIHHPPVDAFHQQQDLSVRPMSSRLAIDHSFSQHYLQTLHVYIQEQLNGSSILRPEMSGCLLLTIVFEHLDSGPRYPGSQDEGGVVQLITHNQVTLATQTVGGYFGDSNPSTSDPSRLTLPTRAGMLVELVAKPIPKQREAGLPTNSATNFSNSLWMVRVPADRRIYRPGHFPIVSTKAHVATKT